MTLNNGSTLKYYLFL